MHYWVSYEPVNHFPQKAARLSPPSKSCITNLSSIVYTLHCTLYTKHHTPNSTHRSVEIISQRPPLSGPTRHRMPADCNFAIALATARREIPKLSAIA